MSAARCSISRFRTTSGTSFPPRSPLISLWAMRRAVARDGRLRRWTNNLFVGTDCPLQYGLPCRLKEISAFGRLGLAIILRLIIRAYTLCHRHLAQPEILPTNQRAF